MDRTLTDSWTGFTTFTLLKKKPPPGFLWSGERLTNIQATTRPDYLWSEIWIGNARKLRGIYFIDPEDGEYKQTIKDARKKLDSHLEAAIPCKMGTRKRFKEQRENVASADTHPHEKTKYACIVEAHESTRKRLESALPRNHEDHIAEKELRKIIPLKKSVWNRLYQKITKISHHRERGQFDESLQFGAQVCYCASSDEKIWMRKQLWTKNGRSSTSCQHGN